MQQKIKEPRCEALLVLISHKGRCRYWENVDVECRVLYVVIEIDARRAALGFEAQVGAERVILSFAGQNRISGALARERVTSADIIWVGHAGDGDADIRFVGAGGIAFLFPGLHGLAILKRVFGNIAADDFANQISRPSVLRNDDIWISVDA